MWISHSSEAATRHDAGQLSVEGGAATLTLTTPPPGRRSPTPTAPHKSSTSNTVTMYSHHNGCHHRPGCSKEPVITSSSPSTSTTPPALLFDYTDPFFCGVLDETLIVWSESDTCDLALSFQEKAGCEEVWEMICQVQGRSPDDAVSSLRSGLLLLQDNYDDEDGDLSEGGVSGGIASQQSTGIQLPPVEMGRLLEIELVLSNHLATQALRDKMANAIEAQDYVPKLCTLFRMCEDLENTEALHTFYQIVKHLFMMNRNNLIEILLSKEHMEDIVGMLEYEPNRPEPRPHRDFLFKKAKFKEVLPIESEQLKEKIHQTYRMQYVQDVCLPAPSLFEENLLSVLNSFIFFARVDIVAMLQEDKKLMKDLFEQLKDPATNEERRKDLACFLKEFCSFSQSLQPNGPQGKDNFYKTLMQNDVLGTIEPCIRSTDPVTRTTTVDMLAMLVDYNPQQIREYLLRQAKDRSDDEMLLNLLIRHIFNDDDVELSSAQQVAHILRILLDPENMLSMQKAEKNEFLSFFYARSIATLCRPMLANVAADKPKDDSYKTANEEALVLRLLCFCIEHHSYQMRQHCISTNLLSKALVLLSSRHHFLKLAALKMLRCVVQLKDDFYNRYIVREKILDKVVACFVENGPKYNLLNSALLELFEFIRLEDVKILIKYTVENHMSSFEDVEYVKTFVSLRMKYEQQKHREEEKEKAVVGAAKQEQEKWKKEKNVDKEEEWFGGEEDEEEQEEGEKEEESTKRNNGELPAARKTGVEPAFPSVLRKRLANTDDDDEAPVFSGATLMEKTCEKTQPRIVIRMGNTDRSRSPSPQTPALTSLTLNSPRALSPKAREDEVTSSAKPPTQPIILKKGLSLVDYEGSSSSSDEEESLEAESVSSSSVSSPAPSLSGSARVDDDVSSTSGDHDTDDDASSVASMRSTNGRRKMEETEEDKERKGPPPVKRVRCSSSESSGDEKVEEPIAIPP